MKFSMKDFFSKCDQIRSRHIKTIQLVCCANQMTGFYMMTVDLVRFTEEILNGKNDVLNICKRNKLIMNTITRKPSQN